MTEFLENENLLLAFDTCLNNVAGLYNKKSGDNYIKVLPDTAVFSIWAVCNETGEKLLFRPAGDMCCEKERSGGTGSLKLKSGMLAGGKYVFDAGVEVFAALADYGREIEWRISVENRDSRFTVVEVLFPHLQGLSLGTSCEDDNLIYPHHAGEKTLNPCAAYRSDRYTDFWRANTRLENGVYAREINYCGLASMMWMYLYDDENGFYMASHDHDFLVTGIRAETGGTCNKWMGFGLRKYITILPGQSWVSNPSVTAVTCEDWHWGAKRYRCWIDRHISIAKHPEYLQDEYVLNQCYNFKKDGKIHNRYSDIPRLFDAGREFSMRHMFIASWNRKGFDCNYPEYHPDMELGSPLDLYNGCRYVNENGGFVTFYINARLFDMASDFFEALGKQMAVKNEKGSFITEKYGDVEFAVMCPGDAAWRKLICDTAVWMAMSYGAAGIYLDQLGSAEPFPCYDRLHSHTGQGDFNTGYMRLIDELSAKLREINSGSFLMIENCGDIYSRNVWGSLTWNGAPYDECFGVFKYTFPEYRLVNMINPRPGANEIDREKRFYSDIGRAMLLGAILWLGPTYKFEKGDGQLREYALKAVKFRGRINPLIKSGSYKDSEGIRLSGSEFDASRWKCAGSEVVLLSNTQKAKNGLAVIDIKRRPACVHIEDIDGSSYEGAVYNDEKCTLEADIPESRLSFIHIRYV